MTLTTTHFIGLAVIFIVVILINLVFRKLKLKKGKADQIIIIGFVVSLALLLMSRL